MTAPDILIVGGGPAGAATAWYLASRGVAVTILDRAVFPRDKVCAEYLSPEASRILSEMGVLDSLESAGAAQLTGMRVRAPSGTVVHGEFAAVSGYRGYRQEGLALRRTELDTILLEAARKAGARVLERVKVNDLVRDSGGRVTGVLASNCATAEATIAARIVIGADGLRSVVGRRARLTRRRRWPRRVAAVGHFANVTGCGSYGEMFVTPDGYAGIAPVGRGIVNFAVVTPVGAGFSGKPADVLGQWIARIPCLAVRFKDATALSPARATGPFAVTCSRAHAPGVALVGDAAEFYDPFTGEGIYTALRGGELLQAAVFDALERPHCEGEALADYETERRSAFEGKWKVERFVASAVGVPAIMNALARSLSRRPELMHTIVGVAGDFVPAREILKPRFVGALVKGMFA